MGLLAKIKQRWSRAKYFTRAALEPEEALIVQVPPHTAIGKLCEKHGATWDRQVDGQTVIVRLHRGDETFVANGPTTQEAIQNLIKRIEALEHLL